MKTSTQFDYTIYFLDPRDDVVYQYTYKDYESADREYRQALDAGYSTTMLVSIPEHERRISKRIMQTEGNC
jgi:hypothetical protein